MLDLARQAAELLVERTESLPGEKAWDGDFQRELEDRLLECPPENGRPASEVMERVAQDVLPFSARLDHPRCFAFVPSSATWPGVLAEFISAGYNFNVCTWLVASGPSQLELVVIEWFCRWFGLPDCAGGLLTSGGSSASLNAFVAAREAAGNPQHPTVYMSNQSHSAQVRAARIVGVRPECIRMIPIDEDFRLDIKELTRAVAKDRDQGCNPIAVCANAGAAGNGAIDPLEAMADYCAAEGIWLHVDAAYGGFAILTDAGKELLRGIERADSIGVDGHKWLFQPYETGGLLVRDVSTLENAFAIKHDVLQDTVWGANHPNFSDRNYQLSRSFRALKIWMSVHTFGMASIRKAVANGMELARRAGAFIRESETLELLAPVSLGIVCFRVRPARTGIDETTLDQVNKNVLSRLFWDGAALMSSTLVDNKFSLRLCIINHNTTWDDVRETLECIEEFGKEKLSSEGEGEQM